MLYWFVHKCSKGFTQIELAVIVVIVGVLAAIAAPNLSKWYHQKQVDAALIEIDTALQEVQNEAVKKHQPCSVTIKPGKNVPLKGNCLLSNAKWKEIFVRTLKNVDLEYKSPDPQWIITFDTNGENRDPSNDPGTLWIKSIEDNVREKCLVISTGIGLRRIGEYNGEDCITR